jgi:putative salt-induced outer membrane protein
MLPALLAAVAVTAAPDTGKHVFFTGDAALTTIYGNAEMVSLSVGDKLVLLRGRWKFTQTFGMNYGRTEDSVTTEVWRGSLRGDRDFSPRAGIFLLTGFERNTFAGFRSRISPSFGVTAVAAAGPRDTLRLEGGGGYAIQKAVLPDNDRSYPNARAALLYRHRLGPKAAFEQVVEILPNLRTSTDLRINSETAISAPISTGIALKASYVIHYEGLPEPGFRKTDRIVTTGVQVTL